MKLITSQVYVERGEKTIVLIVLYLTRLQAKKAVAALKKYYEERPKNDLLGSEEPMLLELTTKKIKPKEKQTLKLTAL